MSDDLVKVSLEGGKYEVIQSAEGRAYALRYGEPWRELVGDTLTLSMAYRIEELEAKLEKAVEALEHMINDAPMRFQIIDFVELRAVIAELKGYRG